MHALAAILLSAALAQSGVELTSPGAAEPAASQPASSPAAMSLRLPIGTQVEVELVDGLSSSTAHLGDRFAIRLAAPISDNGMEVIPAGALGQGEVIDAARAGMGGKQGKLIISARYLDLNGQRVRVRGMTLTTSGTSHVDLATGVLLVPVVGLTSMLIKGGDIEIPAGTHATVRLGDDLDLPIPSPNPPKEITP